MKCLSSGERADQELVFEEDPSGCVPHLSRLVNFPFGL